MPDAFYEDSAPLGIEDALTPLEAEGLLAPLSIEEAKGTVPTPNKVGAFPGAYIGAVGANIVGDAAQVTRVATVEAATTSTSSSL